MSIIGNPIMAGASGVTASIFVTGLSETDTVTATNGSKTKVGVWTQKPNPVVHGLPVGYTELEYIESTGTQYIDTNYIPQKNDEATIEFQATQVSTGFVFSEYEGSAAWRAGIINYGNPYFETTTNWQYSQTTDLTAKTTAVGTCLHNLKYSVYLFGQNENGTAVTVADSKYKLFSCSIVRSGVCIHDYIPCKRNSDGAIGVYDIVTNTFLVNTGTGVFTAGAEIPQTIDGFLIDKIKDFGTWTVTATDGTNTAMRGVLVDVITEYEIEMSLPA